ncbi:MAG TPA: hypothetical protein VF893_04045 [Candidatus Bathyarchaeia archaeon]
MRDLKQVRKFLIPYFFVLVLVASALSSFVVFDLNDTNDPSPATNVGVAFCGNTTEEARLLIDRVKEYTNLFILNAAGNPINRNQTSIEEICDYAVANNLKVIINLGYNSTGRNFTRNWFWNLSSLDGIKQHWTERWGNKFLGMYYSDEPGGIQLDGDWQNYFMWLSALSQNPPPANLASTIPSTYVNAIHNLAGIYEKIQEANGSAPADYDAEADFFVNDVIRDDSGFSSLKKSGFPTFTSDYGLYWFDYLGGYDVMLAQIGWNCSLAQQIDLVRGAARMQKRDWGVIITWKSDSYPYLDTGDQIYNQMMTSYQAGADYIVLFNYPIIDDYGLMSDEHFFALERFWNDATKTNRIDTLDDSDVAEAAMVLPKNYGWGMRRPDDVIWGFWGPDEKSIPIGTLMGKLLAKYGVRMDIIYEDALYPVANSDYAKIYYWNATI